MTQVHAEFHVFICYISAIVFNYAFIGVKEY